MNFDDFQYKKHKELSPHEYELFMEELKEEFIDDMTNNEKYKVFFDKCKPDTIPGFILSYVEAKLHLIRCFSVIIDQDKINIALAYRNDAIDKFNWIKQKKLWDMQLQWRAERIDINEVEICYDFQYWGENIESCPFLPPITDREVELLKEYLRLEDSNEFYGYQVRDWQNYDDFMVKDEHDLYSHCPEFYQYLDDHLFTSYLLNLPNLRGKKEEYYQDLARVQEKRDLEIKTLINPKIPKVAQPVQKKLFYDDEIAVKYAELFEKDKHYIELFKLWQNSIVKLSDNDYLRYNDLIEIVDTLKEAEIPVYMSANADWKIALENCVQKYENEMLIEQLDSVYEEYKMFEEMKITSGKSVKQIIEERSNDFFRELYEKLILDGRELNGEARNFDF